MKTPGFFRRQALIHWTDLVLLVFFVSGALVMINYIAYRHNKRFDLTPEKRYTLSRQAVQILSSLSSDVQATVFSRQEERQALEDLMELFSRGSAYFHYDFIDLEKNPARAEALGIKNFGAGIVEYQGRREKIQFFTEDNLLTTIIKLTEKGEKIVRFVRGHGEKDINGYDQKTSYTAARQALEAENYKVEDLLLLQAEKIPGDTLILVVCGPQKDFLPKELAMLDAYVKEGGRLLMLCDPFPLPNVEAFLKGYQIQLDRDFVIDTQSKLLAFDYLTPIILPDKRHPVARTMNDAVIFPVCRSVIPLSESTSEIIASSGPDSWAEKNTQSVHDNRAGFDRESDLRGPVPVAVAVRSDPSPGQTPSTGQGYLVVIGNSSFATNYYISILGNKDFFLNTIGWLADKRALLSARAKAGQAQVSMFFLTENQSRLVFWASVIVEPAIIFCIGIMIVLWRRFRR